MTRNSAAVRDGALTVACALLIMGWFAPASGAEAYLCGTDNVVYVELENLEKMKRTDPCIASYYGLKVAAPASAGKDRGWSAKPPAAKSQQQRVAPRLRPLIVPDERGERPFVAAPQRRQLETAKAEVVAAPGTDYKNVRIINAKTPEEVWLKLPH